MSTNHCPFCGSDQYSGSVYPRNYFNQKIFEYITCKQCRLIYLTPQPVQDDYMAMYPPAYQDSQADTRIHPEPYKKLTGLRFSYGFQFDQIRQHAGPNAHILDYGCGAGNFIANAIQQGFTCSGAEFNPAFLSILKKGIPAAFFYEITELLEGSPSPRFDVIRLSNVLEHLTDPGYVLRQLKQYLRPGGIFLIEGPVEDNFCLAKKVRTVYFGSRKFLQPRRQVSAPPYHIFLSNRRNQRDFFRKCELDEKLYRIAEDPWPFPISFSSARGSGKITALIAKFSMFLTKVFNRNWGNIFIYIGKPAA